MCLGDIQAEYNHLRMLIQDYTALLQGEYYPRRIQGLKNQLANYERLALIIDQQSSYAQQSLDNATEQYKAYQRHYERGGISKINFSSQEDQYLRRQQNLVEQQQAAMKTKITIGEYERKIEGLTFEYDEKRRIFKVAIQRAIDAIQNAIHQWQQRYMSYAPFTGKVNYLASLSEEQFVQSGQELFAIIPANEVYIAYKHVPLQGYGKVKIGQRAKIKLAPYPSHEYGYRKALVKDISLIAHQGHYVVTLQLERGMSSTYGKELIF